MLDALISAFDAKADYLDHLIELIPAEDQIARALIRSERDQVVVMREFLSRERGRMNENAALRASSAVEDRRCDAPRRSSMPGGSAG